MSRLPLNDKDLQAAKKRLRSVPAAIDQKQNFDDEESATENAWDSDEETKKYVPRSDTLSHTLRQEELDRQLAAPQALRHLSFTEEQLSRRKAELKSVEARIQQDHIVRAERERIESRAGGDMMSRLIARIQGISALIPARPAIFRQIKDRMIARNGSLEHKIERSTDPDILALEKILEAGRDQQGQLVALNFSGALTQHVATLEDVGELVTLINLNCYSLKRVDLSKNNLNNKLISHLLSLLELADSVLETLDLSEQKTVGLEFDLEKLQIFLSRLELNGKFKHLLMDRGGQPIPAVLVAIDEMLSRNQQTDIPTIRAELQNYVTTASPLIDTIVIPYLIDPKIFGPRPTCLAFLEIDRAPSPFQLDQIRFHCRTLEEITLRNSSVWGPISLLANMDVPNVVLRSLRILDQKSDIGINNLWSFYNRYLNPSKHLNLNLINLEVDPSLEKPDVIEPLNKIMEVIGDNRRLWAASAGLEIKPDASDEELLVHAQQWLSARRPIVSIPVSSASLSASQPARSTESKSLAAPVTVMGPTPELTTRDLPAPENKEWDDWDTSNLAVQQIQTIREDARSRALAARRGDLETSQELQMAISSSSSSSASAAGPRLSESRAVTLLGSSRASSSLATSRRQAPSPGRLNLTAYQSVTQMLLARQGRGLPSQALSSSLSSPPPANSVPALEQADTTCRLS